MKYILLLILTNCVGWQVCDHNIGAEYSHGHYGQDAVDVASVNYSVTVCRKDK